MSIDGVHLESVICHYRIESIEARLERQMITNVYKAGRFDARFQPFDNMECPIVQVMRRSKKSNGACQSHRVEF